MPMPELFRDFGIKGARGTQGTCTTQAFFLVMGMSSFLYPMMLMWYYVMMIVFNIKREAIAKIEPFMHTFAVGFYSGLAFLGLGFETLNAQGTFCYVAASPLGCEEIPELECERGGDFIDVYGLWFITMPYIFWNSLSLVALIIIAGAVMRRYIRSRRYYFRPESSADSSGHQTDAAETNGRPRRLPQRLRSSIAAARTVTDIEGQPGANQQTITVRQVLSQCVLYAILFINSTVWSTVPTIMIEFFGKDYDGIDKHFFITCLSITFLPLQGFFLFLIFLRPRYLNNRRAYPELSRWHAAKNALYYPNQALRVPSGVYGTRTRRSGSGPHRASFDPTSKEEDEEDGAPTPGGTADAGSHEVVLNITHEAAELHDAEA